MEKFKAAVIGCGTISPMHLDSIACSDRVDLVAVCDIVLEKADAAAEKYSVPAFYDYHEMFRAIKLDAVHLCLPHDLHTVVAQDAIRAGINVLSEKPMSIRYEDAVETVELAEERGVQYGVIFQCRYNTPSKAVKDRIADGRLGAVKGARVVLTWCRDDEAYYDQFDWKGTWEHEGGGVIIDQAIHSLDLANWMIDSTPVSVQSTLHNRHHKKMVVEDSAEGLIEYENGVMLSFFAMNNYPVDEPIEVRLLCENGRVRLSYDEAVFYYNDGTTEQVDNRPSEHLTASGGKAYWGLQHAVQIDQYYKALAGEEPLDISGREALKIQKIICDIYKNNDHPLK